MEIDKAAIKIRNIFLIYILALVFGIIAYLKQFELAALILISIASIVAIFNAFMTCPYCKQLNGVFFKAFYGGIFPIGKCHHCGKSYFNNENTKT